MKTVLVSLLLLITVLSVDALAAPKKKPDPTNGSVTAFNAATKSISFTASPKATPQVAVVTDQTTVEIHGKNAKPSQIQVGMEIRSVRVGSGNPPEVEDIDLK